MKKLSKISLLPLMVCFLFGCTSTNNETGSKQNDETQQNEENDPKPKDENPTYANWPSVTVRKLTLKVKEDCSDFVPSFEKATAIEVDSETIATDGYFGIYCKTDDANSENEYKAILKEASWTVKTEKSGIFYDAFSPNEQLWMNFGYDSNLKELNICVSDCPIISWPSKYIEDSVKTILPTATDVVPSFDAKTYVATYYSDLNRLAINGYGVSAEILNEYKTKVTNLGWVTRKGDSDDYFAISPNEQLEINYYYESDKDQFNVDVAKYVAPVEGWPAQEIADIVSEMGATGTVLPYLGENKGFSTDTDYYPPIVKIATATDKEAEDGTAAYNQYLLDSGYVKSVQVYSEDTYVYPGTTLIYRAAHLTSCIITIELFNLNDYK